LPVYKGGFSPIGPIAPILTPRWSYLLSAVQVHITTHCMFYRAQHWPKTGLVKHLVCIICQFLVLCCCVKIH